MTKYVYRFGDGHAEGNAGMRDLLGGKGAGLAEMTLLGLPVPPGFTISTEACVYFLQHNALPDGLQAEIQAALGAVEAQVGRHFGDPQNPLLVSVRSGSRASMPGMMDTILNLGVNESTVQGLSQAGPRFAWDSYRRFIQMYGDVVLGVERRRFDEALAEKKAETNATTDAELTAEAFEATAGQFKSIVLAATGAEFPEDVAVQLDGAIRAVFESWKNPRAAHYREMEGLPDSWGTAVTVQAMVFGNMGPDCATGVAFTRNPSTGDPRFFGEYLENAQGEDVVAGIRTPCPLAGDAPDSLEQRSPAIYHQLDGLRRTLENHYRDMQDIEFTVEKGKLYVLQTRSGKRAAMAAVRIAVDMVAEGLIDRQQAVRRVAPSQIDALLHPQLDDSVEPVVLATGIPGGSGAATGRLCFSAEEAIAMAASGHAAILIRDETSPEDIAGMNAARGIITARGGATSHAAVVARGMGRSCVVGCGALVIDEEAGTAQAGTRVLSRGDTVTLDGAEGRLILGEHPMKSPALSAAFGTLMAWADTFRRLRVRANADTPLDARVARSFGAEGIGLCRTEHMFFDGERIIAVREMILAATVEERRRALAKLLPMQQADFTGLFREMAGLPVTIRLLDPPLHEFLPHGIDELAPIAADLGISMAALRSRVAGLREQNPMLGHRGCRLLISYPEIVDMQTEAIIAAACTLIRDEGHEIVPEIMIPLIGFATELDVLRQRVVETAERVIASYGVTLRYQVGTMIELPRAALTADRIAEHADFFSFGTNDLTQTTLGLSRDDASRFMGAYVKQKLVPGDPFATLDSGVAELVRIATERGRRTHPGLKVGICGEHGADPSSVAIFHQTGLDYVSCSPYRVPVARLAAAHAALADADHPLEEASQA